MPGLGRTYISMLPDSAKGIHGARCSRLSGPGCPAGTASPAAFVSLSVYLRFSFPVGKSSSLLPVVPITAFLGHFSASACSTDELTNVNRLQCEVGSQFLLGGNRVPRFTHRGCAQVNCPQRGSTLKPPRGHASLLKLLRIEPQLFVFHRFLRRADFPI